VKRWFSVVAVVLAMMMLGGGSAEAASFNCKKAKSKVEKLICATPELSKADDELGALFKQALKALAGPTPDAKGESSSTRLLREAQSFWLRLIRNRCADAACMLAAYQKRNAELRATVKPSGKSGTYSFENNWVDVLEVTPGHLRFDMNLFFIQDGNSHSGAACGEVDVKNGKGLFVDKELDCEIRWSFGKDGKLTLAQEGRCEDFGVNVSADGTYEAPDSPSALTLEFCSSYYE
jgi:uncharacterized protein